MSPSFVKQSKVPTKCRQFGSTETGVGKCNYGSNTKLDSVLVEKFE